VDGFIGFTFKVDITGDREEKFNLLILFLSRSYFNYFLSNKNFYFISIFSLFTIRKNKNKKKKKIIFMHREKIERKQDKN